VAKILMVQLHVAPYAGVAYLNRAATRKGHSFRLCLDTKPSRILARVGQERPDIVGFSCMTSFYKNIKEIAAAIKQRFRVPILLGGPHPTFCPEVVEEEPFDMICRGEGESALPELLDALDAGTDYAGIKNLWVKQDGRVFKNDLRPLIDPLDEAPLIDWSCYQGTGVESSPPIVFPIRGCPYNCSYCFNEAARKVFRGLGPYIRHFSVERTMQEIQEALRFFGPGPVFFTSDLFGMDLDWMERVLTAYSAATDRPFFPLLHPDRTTDACVDILAKHNCREVGIGVESGSERVREEILNRHYSNRLLIEVAERLHAKGMRVRTYNMIGLPTETENELWETIDLNVRMKTDFPRGAIYTPMPETRMLALLKDGGFLAPDFSFEEIPESVFMTTILKNVDKDHIENSLYFFATAVKFPRLRKLVRRLTHMRPNVLFRTWFYLVYIHLLWQAEQRKLIPYFRYLIANRSSK